MASSSFGFQPGRVFQIIHIKDRYSIEVEKGSVEPGAKVITAKSKNIPSQKFKTVQSDDAPGEFLVSALVQPSDGGQLVWDFVPGEGLVIHNTLSGTMNQIWKTESVRPGNNKIVFIKSKDGTCIRNMGKGKQLALATQDVRDVNQHWELKPTSV